MELTFRLGGALAPPCHPRNGPTDTTYVNSGEELPTLDFPRPDTPTDNAFSQAFNARVRAERFNASWFLSLADARDLLEAWRIDYNAARPPSTLGHLTRGTFSRKVAEARKVA